MERKNNILIVLLIIVIIALGGMYFYKISNDQNYFNKSQDNLAQNQNNGIENTDDEQNKNTNQNEQSNNNSQIPIPPTTSGDIIHNQNPTTPEPGSSTIANVSYENNRYYYNQLDVYAKAIYEAIENNIGGLRLGNYTINVNYDFSELLKKPNGEQELKKSYDDAINAINLDIPNLFYIDFSKIYLNIETTTKLLGTTYKLYMTPQNGSNYFLSSFTSQEQVEEAIKIVESLRDNVIKLANGNTYNKLQSVHDWIIDHMSYESLGLNRASVYGALVENKGVCEAYARVYKYILDKVGITNILVTGTATNSNGETEDHMWNYVLLNEKWYAVDPTWDDPIIYGGGVAEYDLKHRYFLIGSNELFKNHVQKNTISESGKIFTLPTLSTTNY